MVKNKKASGWTILLYLIPLLFFIILVFLIIKDDSIRNNECLIKIAREYCRENDMSYGSVVWNFPATFNCKEERNLKLQRFGFLDEELKKCGLK